MNKNKRKCPYCGSDISYIQALTEISGGEHTCPVCNKNSNIEHSKKIYLPAAILLGIAILAAVLTFLLSGKSNIILILSCVFILVPFIIFFFMTPMYYNLNPIRNEAITPVAKQKIKSKKKSQITPHAVKYEEKKRLEKEKKSMSRKKADNQESSFKDKFSKFVRTYIVVDDEEEEKSTENKYEEPSYDDKDKTKIAKAIKDEDIEKIKENIRENKEEEKTEIDTIDPLAEEEEEFNFVGVYTDTSAYEKLNSRKPVYHSLNKINRVDFEYLPDYIDSINVDLQAIEEEDKENEEILSFFDAQEDDDVYENKTENINVEQEDEQPKTKEEEQEKEENRINYYPERKETISVDLFSDKEISKEEIDDEINRAIETSHLEDVRKNSDNIANMIEKESSQYEESEQEESGLDYSDISVKRYENIEDNSDSSEDYEEVAEKTSFQQELDLSEYKTSSYVEGESIDIDFEESEEDEQDEEFNFEDEQQDLFDEYNGDVVTTVEQLPSASKNKSTKNANSEENSAQEEGFFSKIKNKLIAATEAEREEEFQKEEQAKKIADKERRRKEKEKEKLRKEKLAKKQGGDRAENVKKKNGNG